MKLALGLALLFYIIHRIGTSHIDWNLATHVQPLLIFICILLFPINWGLESLKLYRSIDQNTFSFIQANKAVYAGIITGIFTPNRIGNFLGRAQVVPSEMKPIIITHTFASNLASLQSTLLLGMIGILVSPIELTFSKPMLMIATGAFVCVLLFLSFHPSVVSNISWINKRISSYLPSIEAFERKPLARKIELLALSLLRSFVFQLQFVLILFAFDASLDFYALFWAISITYLITTLFPSLFFGKLFIREASALYVLSQFKIDEGIILISVILLWLINLVIPAIIGYLLLLKTRTNT